MKKIPILLIVGVILISLSFASCLGRLIGAIHTLNAEDIQIKRNHRIVYMHFCAKRFSKADCAMLYNSNYRLNDIFKWDLSNKEVEHGI